MKTLSAFSTPNIKFPGHASS